MRNRWVGYPIQANVWRLPEDEVAAIVADLATLAPPQPGAPPARNFLQWLQAGFGKALTKSFMAPYNFKARRAAAPRGSRAASCRCHLGALTLPCTRRPVPPASPLPPPPRAGVGAPARAAQHQLGGRARGHHQVWRDPLQCDQPQGRARLGPQRAVPLPDQRHRAHLEGGLRRAAAGQHPAQRRDGRRARRAAARRHGWRRRALHRAQGRQPAGLRRAALHRARRPPLKARLPRQARDGAARGCGRHAARGAGTAGAGTRTRAGRRLPAAHKRAPPRSRASASALACPPPLCLRHGRALQAPDGQPGGRGHQGAAARLAQRRALGLLPRGGVPLLPRDGALQLFAARRAKALRAVEPARRGLRVKARADAAAAATPASAPR